MANLFFFGLLWAITICATFCDSSRTFQPKLQWICIPSGIILTIKTAEPFNGTANTVGHQSNCTADGHGQTNTYMVIDFDFDGDYCGVKYENETGTYWVEVEVHESQAPGFEHDAIFNVTCDNASMSYDPYFGFSLDLQPSPLNSTEEASVNQSPNAENGQNYVLHAYLEPSDDSIKYLNRFQLSSCFVEGDQTNPIEIIDSHGCSTDLKFITDIEYDNGYARVRLSSINPYLKMVTVKCKFAICDSNGTCRQSCERHWYDSTLKNVKSFANWIGFNTTDAPADDSQEPSSPSTIIDPFISSNDKLDVRRETIVQLLIPLQPDTLQPQSTQSSLFIDKCYKIDFYFYVFEQCCSFDEIHLLYVIIVVEWIIIFGLILLNLLQCYRRSKTGKVHFTNYEDYFVFEKTGDHGTKDDEPLVREKSFLRRISKRRRPSANSEEIYATIKSRSSTRLQKINPVSQVYDNPHITMPAFFKPPTTNGNEHIYAGSSIEENPAYICQKKMSRSTFI